MVTDYWCICFRCSDSSLGQTMGGGWSITGARYTVWRNVIWRILSMIQMLSIDMLIFAMKNSIVLTGLATHTDIYITQNLYNTKVILI